MPLDKNTLHANNTIPKQRWLQKAFLFHMPIINAKEKTKPENHNKRADKWLRNADKRTI
jgi:hypothetical protein